MQQRWRYRRRGWSEAGEGDRNRGLQGDDAHEGRKGVTLFALCSRSSLLLQGHLEAFLVRLGSGEDEENVNGEGRECEDDSDGGVCCCGGGGDEMSEGGGGAVSLPGVATATPRSWQCWGERLLWQRLMGVLLGGR